MARFILLDLDGTIIDSYDSVLNAIERAYNSFSVQIPKALYETKLVGELLSLAFKTLPGSIEEREFKLVYDSMLNENPTSGVSVSQSVVDMLCQFKKRGYKLIVLTNKNQQIADIICSQLFPPLTFDAVIGRKTTRAIKPMFALEELKARGINLNQVACLIGDSNTDRKTASLLNIAYYDVNEMGMADLSLIVQSEKKNSGQSY